MGTSLNDQLLTGPDLTNSIVGVLMRFREEQVALSADIECMFHDRDAFRFLWWPDGDLTQQPIDHRMEVHFVRRDIVSELFQLCAKKDCRRQQR